MKKYTGMVTLLMVLLWPFFVMSAPKKTNTNSEQQSLLRKPHSKRLQRRLQKKRAELLYSKAKEYFQDSIKYLQEAPDRYGLGCPQALQGGGNGLFMLGGKLGIMDEDDSDNEDNEMPQIQSARKKSAHSSHEDETEENEEPKIVEGIISYFCALDAKEKNDLAKYESYLKESVEQGYWNSAALLSMYSWKKTKELFQEAAECGHSVSYIVSKELGQHKLKELLQSPDEFEHSLEYKHGGSYSHLTM